MRNNESKYAVSNLEIYVDIMSRINTNNINVVTISTLKEILKGRMKRGDENALKYYIKYFKMKMLYVGNVHSVNNIECILTNTFKEYTDEIDFKKRDKNSVFEDIEQKYFYSGVV